MRWNEISAMKWKIKKILGTAERKERKKCNKKIARRNGIENKKMKIKKKERNCKGMKNCEKIAWKMTRIKMQKNGKKFKIRKLKVTWFKKKCILY